MIKRLQKNYANFSNYFLTTNAKKIVFKCICLGLQESASEFARLKAKVLRHVEAKVLRHVKAKVLRHVKANFVLKMDATFHILVLSSNIA